MSQLIKKIRTDSGDLQIDYNALANKPDLNNMFSNPNLLINSDFRNPVNQRGNASYTGTNSHALYTVDRWCVVNIPTVTVQDGSLKIENPSDATFTGRFKQVFEKALPSDFYTLSVKVKSNSHKISVNNFGTIEAGFTGIYSYTTALKLALTDLEFYVAKGGNIEIEWIKLEQGSIATPFAPRLYAEEFMLCRRYYRNDAVRLTSCQHTSRYAHFAYNFEQMRDIPSFSYIGFAETTNHAGVVITNTKVSCGTDTLKDRLTIVVTFAENSAIANYYYLVSAGRVILDAEIY